MPPTHDVTESIRRVMASKINAAVSDKHDSHKERVRLEAQYHKVWDTQQLGEDFEVLGFASPLVVVRRKADKVKGSLFFQHHPRFYWGFVAD